MEHHIRFDADAMTLYLLDQRALPGREDYLPIRTLDETIRALQVMVVRGAPAIGVTAGFGCVLALEELRRSLPAGADWRTAYDQALVRLEAARPTAVNLRWGVERMRALWRAHAGLEMEALIPVLLAEAETMRREDVEICREIGRHGASCINDGDTVLTHCNAGALATAGYGTALGVIRGALEAGKKVRVIADETRPFLQDDVIRIDHFIGIVNFWSIPASCPTAVDGKWRKGPGKKLTDVIKEATKGTDIIAEDLGVVGPNVRKLIQKTGWPGMKILEFAFDGAADNEYLPHNYKDPNCLVYGGTHDNETIMGFYGAKKKKELKYVMDYLQVKKKKQIPMEMIRLGYGSIANTAIFQMQDILGLDNRARMNLPSTVGTNWRWRMLPGAFTKEHCRYLKKLCRIYNR